MLACVQTNGYTTEYFWYRCVSFHQRLVWSRLFFHLEILNLVT